MTEEYIGGETLYPSTAAVRQPQFPPEYVIRAALFRQAAPERSGPRTLEILSTPVSDDLRDNLQLLHNHTGSTVAVTCQTTTRGESHTVLNLRAVYMDDTDSFHIYRKSQFPYTVDEFGSPL